MHPTHVSTGSCIFCVCVLQTSSETFFRTSKFYKAGDEAPPVFIVDGVSYLSIKVGLQDCLALSCWARLHGLCCHRFNNSSRIPAAQHHNILPKVPAPHERHCNMHKQGK